MPKINLLQQAATETASKSKPISTQTGQLIAMAGVVLLGVVVALGYLYITTNRDSQRVNDELAQERKQQQELSKLKAQADELQKKIALVENRVKVIKQLRAEQRGPVAVLSSINERIPIGINLDAITQRGSLMTIIGNSTTDTLITTFAKDLEFSGGLFTGFDVQQELIPPSATAEQAYKFTIRCTYNPPVANQKPEAVQTASN
jgi:Tfp pilus assembly protein PilN